MCMNVGEMMKGSTLNRHDLTAVYLLHCLVFHNLSQNTTISPFHHQHLVRGGWRESREVKMRRGEEKRRMEYCGCQGVWEEEVK